jgi:protein-L-isoaspartate(D-aspartate) O-methyltransferase
MRVLEVGTGTGYNAAILAWCVGHDGRVCSIENQVDLAQRARERIDAVIPWRVHVHSGNGLHGDPEHAPFDRIVATGEHPPHPRGVAGSSRWVAGSSWI